MKHPHFLLLFLVSVLLGLTACSEQNSEHGATHSDGEKPVQHLEVAAITSAEEAATVFAREIDLILGKQELTPGAMHEIHMSTYSLEKAVAYYVENSDGARRELAEQIAVVVEEIHLASENNRAEATKKHLQQLASLAKDFPLKQ